MKPKQFFAWMVTGLILLAPAAAAAAQETDMVQAVKTTTKPEIDGLLEDSAWQSPPLRKAFITYYPIYGEKLPYETLVWTAYDRKNLYFAFQCFDPEPGKIQTSLTRRDNMFNDDWVSVSIDAAGTGQTAYVLYVNPGGIQGDALSTTIGSEDISPDFVWQSAAKITPRGYQVEICLPLKSIRFRSGKEVEMGILFRRKITRIGYTGSWPDIKLGHYLLDSQAKAVFKDIKKQRRLELLPGLTYSSNRERIGPGKWNSSETAAGLGVDLKYGITSAVTVDVTVNPDFSQVESDAFQVEVNQRYPLFYNEKRYFFMEGADIFTFYTCPYGFFTVPVHTRRIVDPDWGVKVTGDLGKITFGLLSAGDRHPGLAWEPDPNPNEGKNAFFGIARGKFSLGRNNYIGVLYSSREFAGQYNRVVGADLVYRLGKYQRFNASFLHSFPGGRSSNLNLVYNYDSKLLLVHAALEHIGTDFNMDTAYIQRKGVNNYFLRSGIAFYPDPQKLSWLKMISPDLVFQQVHDLSTGKDDFSWSAALYFYTTREGIFVLRRKFIKEFWQDLEFKLNQWTAYGEIRVNKWLKLTAKLTYGDMIYYEGDPPFKGKGSRGTFSVNLQPNRKLNQDFSYVHSHLSRDGEDIYNVDILYSNTTYQFNKYFFLRAVIQYDSYREVLLTDLLASFTLIPGTVLHVGYGTLYESRKWQDNQWIYGEGDMINVKRSFFAKVSYLWRF